METFRGHENSRDIKFNENQREKTAIIKTEQNAEGTCKSKKMKEKEQNIWFRGKSFLCDGKTKTHVDFIYIRT